MTVFEKIELFNKERGLLNKYAKLNEVSMLSEELTELVDAQSEHDEVDALCDIIVVTIGALLKLKYNPTTALEETCKEILSRKGSIGVSGKWQKDKSVKTIKADYTVAKLTNE